MTSEEDVIDLEELSFGIDITGESKYSYGYNHGYGNAGYPDSCRIYKEGQEYLPLMMIERENINRRTSNSHTENVYLREHPLMLYIFTENLQTSTDLETGSNYYTDTIPPYIAHVLREEINKFISANCFYSRKGNVHERVCKLKNCTNEQIDLLLAHVIFKAKLKIQKEFLLKKPEESKEFRDGVPYENRNYFKYQDLLKHFFSRRDFSIFRGRDLRQQFVVANYYLAHYNSENGVTTPLVCVMVRREHLLYAKACYMMNEPIDPACLELWVKDDFDVVRSAYGNIRPKYRKFIKKPLLDAGVTIKNVKNFEDMFLKYTPPIVHSIDEYEDFLKNSSITTLNSLRKSMGIVLQELTK